MWNLAPWLWLPSPKVLDGGTIASFSTVTYWRWVIATADGDMYEEDLRCCFGARLLLQGGYHCVATGVVSFADCLTSKDALGF